MNQTFRHPEILEIARREGQVTVDGLAEHFGVTAQTIRRDLSELAVAGRLARVHGGAVLPSGVANIGYQDRRVLNAEGKAAMAQGVAKIIPDGASLFLNIGTSTEAVAQALAHHQRLLVVTNNMNVANILLGNPGVEVVVAGGTMRHSDGGLVGPMVLRMVEQFSLDFAVIGCSGLDMQGDILDFDLAEVSVSQAMLSRAKQSILVADRSKFQRSPPVRIASLNEIDTFVTDAAPPKPVQTIMQRGDTDLVI